jgi:phospholipase/carboxylesterase
MMITRRRFVTIAGGAVGSVAFGNACMVSTRAADSDGRLTARPRPGVSTTLRSGPIGLGTGGRDGVIRMPSPLPTGRLPLLTFLHGATQTGERMISRIGAAADESGVVIVAPDSRNGTWDAIRNTFGEDVAFLNRVLESVFARLDVDPARLGIGGFSDGASYGLSLGLANGDLFPRVVACSPGFVIQTPSQGRPRIFISHGTADQILPIDQCSRVIVPRLRSMKYDVTFREFEGRHELPPAIASEALRWMADSP